MRSQLAWKAAGSLAWGPTMPAECLRDTKMVRSHFGRLIPMAVLITVPRGQALVGSAPGDKAAVGRTGTATTLGSGRRREVVVENGEHYSSQRSSASAVSQRAAALRRRTWRSAPDGGAGAGAGLGAAVGLSASGGRSFAARAVEDRGLDVNSRRSWGGSDGNSAHLALWRMERLEGKSAAGMGRLEMRRAAEERVGESRAGLVGRCPGFPVLGL